MATLISYNYSLYFRDPSTLLEPSYAYIWFNYDNPVLTLEQPCAWISEILIMTPCLNTILMSLWSEAFLVLMTTSLQHNTGPLARCPSQEACNESNNNWPTSTDISTALSKSTFDTAEYNEASNNSFRNFLEPVDNCTGRQLCTDDGGQRYLHNAVSSYYLVLIQVKPPS